MNVIIAGTRTINNYSYLEQAIEESKFEITKVLCGGCRGVDELGRQWAIRNQKPYDLYLAKWEEEGRKAGVLRNQRMVEHADALIVIWNEISKGTADVIIRAERKGIPVYKFIIKTTH